MTVIWILQKKCRQRLTVFVLLEINHFIAERTLTNYAMAHKHLICFLNKYWLHSFTLTMATLTLTSLFPSQSILEAMLSLNIFLL